MSAYSDELLAHSRNSDLHAEAARVARGREAAAVRPARQGSIARLLARVRVTPHVEGSPRPVTARAAE